MTTYKKTVYASKTLVYVPADWDYTINGSNDRITVADGANATVIGNNDTLSIGANDVIVAKGSNINIYASGAGDNVTIGGNGQFSTADNYITFAQGGVFTVMNYSRADIVGSHVTGTIDSNVTVGLYGTGNTLTATGANNSIWVGGNSQTSTGSDVDYVTTTQAAIFHIADCSAVNITGPQETIYVGANDTVTANGAGDVLYICGTGDSITLNNGGTRSNQKPALAAVANFAATGTLITQAYSNVVANGNYISVNVGSGALATLNGSHMTVTVADFGYAPSIGASATRGSSTDVVVNGDYANITDLGDAHISLHGLHETITALNAGGYDSYHHTTTPTVIDGFGATDTLVVSRAIFHDFATLMADARQVGSDVLIGKSPDSVNLGLVTFNLHNVQLSSLTESMFKFA